MKITTCYTVPILGQVLVRETKDHTSGQKTRTATYTRGVDQALMHCTAGVCLAALKLCVGIFRKEWGYLSAIPVSQKKGRLSRKRAGDLLVHSTNGNPAKYPAFDRQFPYFPSYMRRAVIADALGIVSSYMTNHKVWEDTKPAERGAEPVIGIPSQYGLTFYDQERDLCDLGKGIIGLKLYNGTEWGWYFFRIPAGDAKTLGNMKKSRKMLSPVVEKYHGKYRIRFAFEERRGLVPEDESLHYRILAVDLGINAPASWCVMTADGTVHAKGVIHLPCDEDRLRRMVNRKRKQQRSGKKPRGAYRMVANANKQLSINTMRAIMDTAVLYDVDCIVFEHLDRPGKGSGKPYRERIHLWRANDIQKRVELQAHRHGMRISRVCAWGTSRLAFDGSGPVARDKDNHSLCTFTNGKRYNCDLSASQNIGARYFLRLLSRQKGCPELPKAPQRTYATLLSVPGQALDAAA